jgi:hypothetical protein
MNPSPIRPSIHATLLDDLRTPFLRIIGQKQGKNVGKDEGLDLPFAPPKKSRQVKNAGCDSSHRHMIRCDESHPTSGRARHASAKVLTVDALVAVDRAVESGDLFRGNGLRGVGLVAGLKTDHLLSGLILLEEDALEGGLPAIEPDEAVVPVATG